MDGETNVTKWNYKPHEGNWLDGKVTQNTSATGYRLPTSDEWEYAAKGGENYYKYAGSNNVDDVAWCYTNSGWKSHPVAQKKANGYGLYDMSGNVCEWVWDVYPDAYDDYDNRFARGGSWYNNAGNCGVEGRYAWRASHQGDLGIRIVRSSK